MLFSKNNYHFSYFPFHRRRIGEWKQKIWNRHNLIRKDIIFRFYLAHVEELGSSRKQIPRHRRPVYGSVGWKVRCRGDIWHLANPLQFWVTYDFYFFFLVREDRSRWVGGLLGTSGVDLADYAYHRKHMEGKSIIGTPVMTSSRIWQNL